MKLQKPTEVFKYNILLFKILGTWMGRVSKTKYLYFSLFYLTFAFWIYDIILIVNIIFTPLEIRLWINEVEMVFPQIGIISKVLTLLFMKKKIFEIFDMLDSSRLMEYENDTCIREKAESMYKKYFIFVHILDHMGFLCYSIIPILRHIFFGHPRSFPVCNFYFLSDELREKYFVFLWIYQVFGIYGKMIFNETTDTFFAGLLLLGIVQFKMLNRRLTKINLKKEKEHFRVNKTEQYTQQMNELKDCLMFHSSVLKYCSLLQNLLSVSMFFIYAVSTCIVCISLYAFKLGTSKEYYFYMGSFLIAFVKQIFIPSFLGNQIIYESQQLSVAIYKSNWLDSSRPYKHAMMLLTERSNKPVVLSGLKWFPLSLDTFTSIMQTGYSMFTLLKSFEK